MFLWTMHITHIGWLHNTLYICAIESFGRLLGGLDSICTFYVLVWRINMEDMTITIIRILKCKKSKHLFGWIDFQFHMPIWDYLVCRSFSFGKNDVPGFVGHLLSCFCRCPLVLGSQRWQVTGKGGPLMGVRVRKKLSGTQGEKLREKVWREE